MGEKPEKEDEGEAGEEEEENEEEEDVGGAEDGGARPVVIGALSFVGLSSLTREAAPETDRCRVRPGNETEQEKERQETKRQEAVAAPAVAVQNAPEAETREERPQEAGTDPAAEDWLLYMAGGRIHGPVLLCMAEAMIGRASHPGGVDAIAACSMVDYRS